MAQTIRGAWLVALACATCVPTALGPLPDRERSRFAQCTLHMAPHACPEGPGEACDDRLAERYARLPNEQSRQQYLVANGCPPAVAEYLGPPPSSGGAAEPAADARAPEAPASEAADVAEQDASAPTPGELGPAPAYDGDAATGVPGEPVGDGGAGFRAF